MMAHHVASSDKDSGGVIMFSTAPSAGDHHGVSEHGYGGGQNGSSQASVHGDNGATLADINGAMRERASLLSPGGASPSSFIARVSAAEAGGGSHTAELSDSTTTRSDFRGTEKDVNGMVVEYKGIPLQSEIGRLEFDEGYYIGTVDEEGRMVGYGKATWKTGDTYEGEWMDNCMHGQGKYTWADGDYYQGEYVNGYMNGYGEMKDSTGRYVGQWVNDTRQGKGRMEYAGGNLYEGQWLAGMRHGFGKLTETPGVVYEGDFVRNEKEGRGEQTNVDGDVFEGEFARGKPNGRGTYIWADGAKYVGYFKDGLKHGQGCEWLANGDWVAGNFVDGEHDHQQPTHKAVAEGFCQPELPDELVTALEPLDPATLKNFAMAAVVEEDDEEETHMSSYGTRLQVPMRNGGTSTGTDMADGQGDASRDLDSNGVGLRNSSSNGHQAACTGLSASFSLSASSVTRKPMILTNKELYGWKQLKIIGKGSFGAVYEALLPSGRTVCCKVIELGSLSSSEELEKLQMEISLMKRLFHPNIVQYHGSLEEKEKKTVNIFMEIVSGGSLNSFVKKFKTIPPETVKQWAYQMVCGVKYLHECGIVHRDIKGENVLVSHDGIVKLADFGCSKAIDDVCSSTHGCATMVGTPYWMAPEVIKCEAGGYGKKSDIWSIGCTIVEMLTGKPPWPECNSMWAAVYKIANSTGLPTEIPKDIDPQMMQLLERCFERDPRKRPTAAELLEEPYLKGAAELDVSS